MNTIYQNIQESKAKNERLLAILIDPDKVVIADIAPLSIKINSSPATHIFIGGSLVKENNLDELIIQLKQKINLPILLFPGDPSQISNQANGILFLSLLSGRNPDYLIEHQVNAVPFLQKTNLEIIPTGYILIESGSETAVERVSKTKPLSIENEQYIMQTALAGQMLGNQLIYLEAGSGAKQPVPENIIELVAKNIKIPLLVGGGIKSKTEIEKAYLAGANIVVIGTAFEKNLSFFD